MPDVKSAFAAYLTKKHGNFVSLAVACEELKVSRRVLDRRIANGELRAYRLRGGRSYRLLTADVADLLEEL